MDDAGVEVSAINIVSIKRTLNPPPGYAHLKSSVRRPTQLSKGESKSVITRFGENIGLLILAFLLLIGTIAAGRYCPDLFGVDTLLDVADAAAGVADILG